MTFSASFLAQTMTEMGIFFRLFFFAFTKENFPKDYFLIPKNLPYLVGMTLYDPSSSTLNLSQEQIDAIVKIKKELMANATEKALKIKKLELEVVEKIGLKYKDIKAEDLYTTIDVPFSVAALGGEIKFKHKEDEINVIIPAGVQVGDKIRIPNAGVKKEIFEGDLYLICNVIIPKKLTNKQKELLEEFSKTEKEKRNIFFESIKNILNKFN